MGRLGSPVVCVSKGKVLAIGADEVDFFNKEEAANPVSEVIFRSQRREVIFSREEDQGPPLPSENQRREIVWAARPTGLVTAGADEAMDSDNTSMDSHTMDFPDDVRIVHRGPLPGKPQREIVWSSSDSGRSSSRIAKGRGRAPGTRTPNTVRRRKRREMLTGNPLVPAESATRSGGPRAHLQAEDTSDWTEQDKRNGGKRGQMVGGGGPVPAHRASPDPYAMSPDDDDDISSDDNEDDPPRTPRRFSAAGNDNSCLGPLDDFGVTPKMARAAREMEDFFSHETDEWNQARHDAAAALQRAMDRRKGAVVPVGRPYPLDGHLHGAAAAASAEQRRRRIAMPQRRCSRSRSRRATPPPHNNATATLQPQPQPHPHSDDAAAA